MSTTQTPVEWAKEQLLKDCAEYFALEKYHNILMANIERVFSGAEWRYTHDRSFSTAEKSVDSTHRFISLAPEPIKPKDDLVERLRNMAKQTCWAGMVDILNEAAERLSKGCEK